MTIDPMADFVNYQSPYVMADNNPILNIDFFGLGKRRCGWLCRAFNRIVFGKKNVNSRSGRKIKDKIGKSRGTGWDDITPKKKDDSSPDNDDCTDCGSKTRIAMPKTDLGSNPLVALPSNKLPNIQKLNPRIFPDDLVPPRGKRIRFDRMIGFEPNSNKLSRPSVAEKTLYDLIKTLQDYPHLKVIIEGNTSTFNTAAQRHKEAGEVNPVYKKTQNIRAQAIRQFLLDRGINLKRIEARRGEHRYQGPSGMTSTFIIVNPK